MLSYFPLPNNFDNTEFRNNYIAPIGTKIDYFSNSFRVDHNFNERHRLFGSFAASNLDEPGNRRFEGSVAVGQIEDRRHRGLSIALRQRCPRLCRRRRSLSGLGGPGRKQGQRGRRRAHHRANHDHHP